MIVVSCVHVSDDRRPYYQYEGNVRHQNTLTQNRSFNASY